MPSSLFADMERNGSNQVDALDDQRALQIALDQLSLLGLDNDENSMYDNEPRKKSVNMTECVPVPSSEHVAEIVGRQGCKIKALRAKTNTYIKTPVRGEEPVFVVTGRREDVAMARREIISAAEHFSMIRASRNKNSTVNGSGTVPGPPNLPGQTTIQVRVPYRVVGLVVGPKGATIKRIQQQTHTYIVTPSRDKEPVFEVTGMPENVDRAREEIEAHIAMRTGGLIELTDENDFHANGTDVGFDLHGHASLWSKPTSTSTTMTPNSGRKPFSNYRNDSSSSLGSASTDSYFGNNSSSRLADYSPPSPALSYTASNNGNNNNNNVNINVNTNGNEFVYGSEVISPDCTDLTFESSPGFDPTPAPPGLLWSQYERGVVPAGGNTSTIYPANASTNANGMIANQRRANGVGSTTQPRLSPPLNHVGGTAEHPLARRVRSDPGGGTLSYPGNALAAGIANLSGSHLPGVPSDSSASSTSSSSSSSSSGTSRKGSRDCSVCFESEVIAALVPCGHNLFCMECANRICDKHEPKCPVCLSAVTQAIRIFS
ncbi:RNA-binding protein MEX3B [Clupea harengus]|uniref:RNA-binding protein MEX3B n=1 Tax=Clupea harengus TaxID=7950 RepID=A0A6P3VIF3_CLUHA|nr:RNA-binding protein MEX3B [Clupea harengus]